MVPTPRRNDPSGTLKTHAVPYIIALAYLTDSIGQHMNPLRFITLILTVCYVCTITYCVLRLLISRRVARRHARRRG